jgi:4-hydroxy-3-polyprenylbenzoate decarboxylase
MEVSAITHKKNPTYLATVVGKPPLEDKYMGYATERIFLPLLKTTAPDLIDYYMPENGVFHNLILAKIKVCYPGHASQIMHAFWGVGQMSFVKHAIFVDENAPNLEDDEAITRYILDRFDVNNVLISNGVVDALDHSSPKFAVGGKLGIDCTNKITNFKGEIISDEEFYKKLSKKDKNIIELKQYYTDTPSPICIVKVDKTKSQLKLIDKIKKIIKKHTKIFVIVDKNKNNLNNPYMLIWRIVNNIDSNRDIKILKNSIAIDATNKNYLDDFNREWPDDVECSSGVLESLRQRGIINIDDEFIEKFML